MQDNFSIRNWKNTKLYKEEYNGQEESDYTVKLLVPKVYFNVEAGELSDNKYEWYTEDELQSGADQTFYTNGTELDDMVFSNDYDQALNFAKRYPTLIKIVKDSVQEQDELEADDIELEIPGDESTATVDKAVQAKASKQDQVIQAYKDITAKMKDTLEKYKAAEGDEKEAAKEELKTLTPEFQAAKKAYEKLKGVKL